MPHTESLERIQKIGRERLYPALTDPNWLVLRKRRQIFQSWLRGGLPGYARVLDVGGRLQPYRALLGPEVNYLAVDLRPTPLTSIAANAERLPLGDDRFDLVFCTQMLEYASDPGRVILEIHRVLKPGGRLLLSVPSVFPRDSDADRWRFLPAGIRQLLSSFSSVQVVPEGSSIAGCFRTVNVYFYIFAKYRAAQALLSYTVVPLLNLLGLGCEKLARSQNDAFAVNYSVSARK